MADGERRAFSTENLGNALVSGLAGYGIGRLVDFIFGISVTILVAVVIGASLVAFAALLLIQARRVQAETKPMIGRRAASQTSPATTAEKPERWTAQHGPFYHSVKPPHNRIELRAFGGFTRKKVVCQVTDPAWQTMSYFLWDPSVSSMHLPPLHDVRCGYPHMFDKSLGDDWRRDPPLMNGRYYVQWWADEDDGARELLAEDSFGIAEGGLVQ